MFLRIVALLSLDRHKGGAVEALVARLLGQRHVGQARGLRDGLRDGHSARQRAGYQQDQHDQDANPSLLTNLSLLQRTIQVGFYYWSIKLTMLIFELLDLAMKSFHLELKGNYFEQYFSKRDLFQPN